MLNNVLNRNPQCLYHAFSTPEEYCTQAIQLLENLPEGSHLAYQDVLAQAKFWLYVCQLETCILVSVGYTFVMAFLVLLFPMTKYVKS